MQSTVRKILIGTVFFVLTTVVAVLGYWWSGWTLLESIYMVTITIYGVGYGEVRPIEDPRLMVFTIGVILAGCTSAIYVMGGLIQLITEGELNRVLGARRMSMGIEKLSNHVIVCGYGRVGRILAEDLKEAGQEFVVIDTDKERLQEAEESGMFVIVGDATQEDVLISAGVERARTLASVLPNDAANIFITLSASEVNPDMEIIARGESPSTEKKLLRSGAKRVVLPAAIGAARIARLITRPSAEQFLSNAFDHETLNEDLHQIGLQVSEFSVDIDSEFIGHSILDLTFGRPNQFVVIAVRHANESVTRNPDPDYEIQAQDTVIVMAHRSVVPKLKQQPTKEKILYRGARG